MYSLRKIDFLQILFLASPAGRPIRPIDRSTDPTDPTDPKKKWGGFAPPAKKKKNIKKFLKCF